MRDKILENRISEMSGYVYLSTLENTPNLYRLSKDNEKLPLKLTESNQQYIERFISQGKDFQNLLGTVSEPIDAQWSGVSAFVSDNSLQEILKQQAILEGDTNSQGKLASIYRTICTSLGIGQVPVIYKRSSTPFLLLTNLRTDIAGDEENLLFKKIRSYQFKASEKDSINY